MSTESKGDMIYKEAYLGWYLHRLRQHIGYKKGLLFLLDCDLVECHIWCLTCEGLQEHGVSLPLLLQIVAVDGRRGPRREPHF